MDDVEAAFTAAIMQTAELVIPPHERRRPGRGWSGDARTEAELQAATDAMHAAWQRLKMDTRDAQLRRAVRKACNWLKKVQSAAVVCFFERHVVKWRHNCAWKTSVRMRQLRQRPKEKEG